MATMYSSWCRDRKRGPAVGDLVYHSHTPQHPGVVTDAPGRAADDTVQVRWSSGEVRAEPVWQLKSLDALIEETEGKLARHRERAARLRAEAGIA